MTNWLEVYQHIPYYINPEIFHFTFFSLNWYALMYLIAFFAIFKLLKKRICLEEGKDVFINAEKTNNTEYKSQKKQEIIFDFLFFCFLGVIFGGRLGYVFFYDFSFYFAHPLAIISPLDISTGEFVGIYGMSYHGGLLGVLLAALVFVKLYKLDFWALSDFITPVIPAGYFFGRIGNFLNGELYGRVTDMRLGMYFPKDNLGALRHPSQLYEAFLEGFLLFVFFWVLRNKFFLQRKFLALYLISYAGVRFLGEFFREPDAQIGFIFGNFFTLGQLFSVVMFLCGLSLLVFFSKKSNRAIIKKC